MSAAATAAIAVTAVTASISICVLAAAEDTVAAELRDFMPFMDYSPGAARDWPRSRGEHGGSRGPSMVLWAFAVLTGLTGLAVAAVAAGSRP